LIEFYSEIKPYNNINECGDFYIFEELDDYYLCVVGDIGGHGSEQVYKLATLVKETILKNKQIDDIEKILQIIHNIEEIKNNGLTIFIAQIFKKIPIVNYLGIGNLKGFIYRKKSLKPLYFQDGIVSYTIPTNIKKHLIKMLDSDILFISTDGISVIEKDILEHIKYEKDIQKILKYCINNFSHEDDRLCIAIKYGITNKDFQVKKYEEIISNKKIANDIKTLSNI